MLDVDFEKIPVEKEVKTFDNWENYVLFGGEDYGIIATVDNPCDDMTVIGEVKTGSGVKICGEIYTSQMVENNVYKHFA